MKKIILALLAINFAFADGFFMGLESGMVWQKIKQKDGEFLSGNNGFGGIKAGYDFDISRIYAQFDYNGDISDNKKYLQNYDLIGGIDFTPEIWSGFKLLSGVYMGVNFCDLSKGDTHSKQNLPLLGAKIGAVFDINPLNARDYEAHWIEFGAKFDTGFFKKNGEFSSDLKSQKMAIFLGYSYKF